MRVFAGLALSTLLMTSMSGALAAPQLLIGSDGFLDGDNRMASATPFDPTTLSRDQMLGGSRYSSRRVALELIINAARVRNNDNLVYRRTYRDGYRVSHHWRLRASTRRLMVRYEIRF